MTATTLSVVKEFDEARGHPTGVLTVDNELFLDLEADSAYWIELGVLMRAGDGFGARFYHCLKYDGVLYDPGVHLQTRSMPVWSTISYENRGAVNVDFITGQSSMESPAYNFNDSGSFASTYRGTIWTSGRITTTSAGRLGLWWYHWDNGAGSPSAPSTVFAGSFIYVTPLDICPI